MDMLVENQLDLVARVAEHVKTKFLSESSGHDWHHIRRVWKLARQIAAAEGANMEVAELGALLHDIADWKFHAGDESVGPREAERLLHKEGVSARVVEAVIDIVATISYKGAGVATPMRSLEGRCVQDADRIDGLHTRLKCRHCGARPTAENVGVYIRPPGPSGGFGRSATR